MGPSETQEKSQLKICCYKSKARSSLPIEIKHDCMLTLLKLLPLFTEQEMDKMSTNMKKILWQEGIHSKRTKQVDPTLPRH